MIARTSPERAERVLQHMIEAHGLRFHATVMGHYVPEYKLENTEIIGVGEDNERGDFRFSAIVEGTQFLFRVERIKVDPFKDWVDKAFEHLATEHCAEFAKIPDEIMVYVEVSQCTAGLKSYKKKTESAALAA